MENASKALIIVGSILIAILVISIGAVFWNSASTLSQNYDEKLTNDEINAFNNKFLVHAKDVTAQEMVSVINLIGENNKKFEGISDRIITLVINGTTIDLNQPESFKIKIMQQEDGTGNATYRLEQNGVEFYNSGFIKVLRYTTNKLGYVNDATTCNPHAFSKWKKSDDNSHKRICSKCGTVQIVAHNIQYDIINNAEHKKRCTDCEYEINQTHMWSGWNTTKASTCTVAGTQIRTCICGAKETRSIAALGHTGGTHANGGKCTRCSTVYQTHTWGGWGTTKEPTCTVAGSQMRLCTCGVKDTRSVAALGHTGGTHANGGKCTRCSTVYQTHTWGSWETTKDPTCTVAGSQMRLCTCGAKGTRSVAALGHTGGTHANGGKCTRCSTIYQTHTWGSWGTTKDPTCTKEGTQTRTCKCGTTETKSIAALGHNNTAAGNKRSDATCTAPATYWYNCSRCGKESSLYYSSGSAAGHRGADKNGKCAYCGYYYTGKGGLVFNLYQKILGRNATESEILNWVNASSSAQAWARGIGKSPEARNRYGSNYGDYVEGLYLGILGRASDPDGKQMWVNIMRTEGIDAAVDGMSNCQEFRNRVTALGLTY